MVNFHDPEVEIMDSLALSKFWHAVGGLYIWEFFTTLDFEWSIIQRGRRYRWSIWIYSLTRLAALVAVIVSLTLLNISTQIDCELSVILVLVPSYITQAAASFLLVLRIVAIWNKNRVAIAIATSIWGINSAFLIQGISRYRFTTEVPTGLCRVAPNNVRTEVTMTGTFVADLLLLTIMLLGLFRLGYHRHGAMALGRFLWSQGVIWLLLATFSGILPMVFVYLDLNASLEIIFIIPWLITMSIAATRMYRALDDFFSSNASHYHDSPHVPSNSNCPTTLVSRGRDTPAMAIPVEIKVHIAQDQPQTSQNCQHSSGGSVDRQLYDRPHGLV